MVAEKRVLVIGSGGIAGFYGALLHQAGWCVEMVARSDHAVIRENGLQVNSLLGDLSFQPEKVYANVADAEAADLIIVAVKMLPQTDIAALVKPVITASTTLCLIANGLDVEQPLRAAFPANPLISCVAFVGTSRVAPGCIEHVTNGSLILGNVINSASTCQQLAEDLAASGITTKVTDNIARERWKKSIWNASFNPLSVITKGADTGRMLGSPEGEALVAALMTEVVETANAEGHHLPLSLVEKNLATTRAMPPYQTSMALDYLHGRPIELDAILGRVIAAADRHQLAMPHLRTLHTALLLS